MILNQILIAITRQLKRLVPDVKDIYVENSEQHTEKPCFHVQVIPLRSRDLMGGRQRNDYFVAVSFLCDAGVHTLRMVMEHLSFHFRFIEQQNDLPLVTQDRNVEFINDGQAVLTFKISQTIKIEPTSDVLMKEIRTKAKVQND